MLVNDSYIFFSLLFSSMANLWFPFSVFIAHSTIALMSSSSADASNARMACGLMSLRTWRKCCYDFNQFITLYR